MNHADLHADLQADLARSLRDAGWLTFTEIEVPGTGGRVDVAAVKPHAYARRELRAYEVKASRRDLVRDLDAQKFRSYLAVFHRLYFAAPSGLVRLDELPKDVGLIVKTANGWQHVRAPSRGNLPEKLSVDAVLALLYRGYEEHGAARRLAERLEWESGVPVAARRLGRRWTPAPTPPAREPLADELAALRDLLEESLAVRLRSRGDLADQARRLRRFVAAWQEWERNAALFQRIAGWLSSLSSPWQDTGAAERLERAFAEAE